MNNDKADFAICVERLKHTIERAVTNALENFQQDTGVSPSDIAICMTERSAVGDRVHVYGVSGVVVEFKL